MNKETVLEITRRLYKAYTNFNEKESKVYTVKGEGYKFQIILSPDPKMMLSTVSEGSFNDIEKIVKAIPYIYLLEQTGIELSINVNKLIE